MKMWSEVRNTAWRFSALLIRARALVTYPERTTVAEGLSNVNRITTEDVNVNGYADVIAIGP
jgi:hypothetical protein